MKISDAKAIVRLHPKAIGDFRRNRFIGLRDTRKINAMQYTAADGSIGFSVGDGNMYAGRLERSDGGLVMVPDLNRVLS